MALFCNVATLDGWVSRDDDERGAVGVRGGKEYAERLITLRKQNGEREREERERERERRERGERERKRERDKREREERE